MHCTALCKKLQPVQYEVTQSLPFLIHHSSRLVATSYGTLACSQMSCFIGQLWCSWKCEG